MKLFVLPILLLITCGDAHRILGLFAFHGKSHFIMMESLMKGLVKRGHQVDIMSHFPQKKPFPNYTDIIDLSGTMPNLVNNMTFDFVKTTLMGSPVPFIATVAGNEACKHLGHPKMQEIIKNPPKDPPYDLVIVEVFGANCYIALGHHLKVPVVAVSTSVLYPWLHDPTGNPDNPSYIPDVILGLTGHMNFWERLQNTVSVNLNKIVFNYLTSEQDEIIRRHVGPGLPGIRELERQIALVLVNSHYSLSTVKPLTPAVIEVGGLHVQDDGSELSPELKKWLDESKDGFVYFTLGSMVKIESFPKEFLAAIYRSFAKIAPIRVLMKVHKKDELLPGLPENVLTLPWISQQKVLNHKNVRAFITHGGLLGTQEAVHFGVPLIGIPLFGDQDLNIRTYVNKNMAVALHYSDLNEENVDAALNAVLKNPIYRKSAKEISASFRDRPLSAMDTAIFWVEYVIRNGGSALRSPALDLTWWQLALLDVYATLLFGLSLVVYLAVFAIKKLLRLFSNGSNKNLKSKKSKKVQ